MAAVDRYRLEIRRRPLLRRLPHLVLGIADRLDGSPRGPVWPITAVLIDRSDGTVVGEVHNVDGDPRDVIGAAHTDLVWLDEVEFEGKWLPGHRSAARALHH